MMYKGEEQQEWCVTDLFQLTKSYEQILRDHVLIEAMKNTLHEAKADRCFYEEIREAYFQCGIILRGHICTSYMNYERLFIYRRSRFYGDLDKQAIACMVHLLLTKRKSLPEGVAALLDCIEYKIYDNPFKKLYAAGKYKHDIDFGVRPKPLDAPVWKNVNWYDLGLLWDDPGHYEMDDPGTPEEYCKDLTWKIDEFLKINDFQDESEILKALDRIGEFLHDDVGCIYDDCEFYHERPAKCAECEEGYLALEPPYFNPLRKRVIEEMKQAVSARFEKTEKKPIPSENKCNSPIRLRKSVEKAELERVIYALCKMNWFESPDKDVFKAFGELLQVDLSNYQNGMKLRDTSKCKLLETFTEMENTIIKEWEKRNGE